jgi:hypothetical protein
MEKGEVGWKKEKYLKIHIIVAVNVKIKKILSMIKITTYEHIHDNKVLP